jgi:hypothetical protein
VCNRTRKERKEKDDRFELDTPKAPLRSREALDENEPISVLVHVAGTVTLQPYSENGGMLALRASQAFNLLDVLYRQRDLLYEHRED